MISGGPRLLVYLVKANVNTLNHLPALLNNRIVCFTISEAVATLALLLLASSSDKTRLQSLHPWSKKLDVSGQ